MRRHPQPAPDFTDAFLATLGLILFMGFWVIASLAGFLWVALTAFAMNMGLRGLARLRRSGQG